MSTWLCINQNRERAIQFPGSIQDLQALIEVIPNPVMVKNRAHRVVLVNTLGCEFLGRSREELLDQPDHELFPADQVRVFHEGDDRVFENGGVDEREEQVTDGAGGVRHAVTRKQLTCLDGTTYLVAVISDVTAYRQTEARLRRLTYYDTLTGLPNGTTSDQHFNRAFAEQPSQCALILIDLDQFRLVNDTHGFPVGNELLVEFAQRLTGIGRPGDTVARLGGDAFSILMTDGSDRSSIEERCENVLKAASGIFRLSRGNVQISASIGVVFARSGQVAPDEMKRRADVALHQAKADGRDRWCTYSDELDLKLKSRQATEADLRETLSEGAGIEIHYQPLAAVASGEVIGFEALARWRHATRGMVQPDDFIPVAEASGLIVPLGELVLRKACQDAAQWDPPLRLSVNVSPVQFVQGDLVGTVTQALADSGLDPDRLELEITEGVLMDNANRTLDILMCIKALGVKIVLDDFGSGFSSLSYLRHFPFDKVKIDKCFITDIVSNNEAAACVQAVLTIGKSLGMEVVAEGVETVDQLDLLRDLGCNQAQGYLISRPMPIESFVGSILQANASEPARADPELIAV